jgi:hypothetical protein
MTEFILEFSVAILAALVGGILICGSLFLIYNKSISIDKLVGNPSLEGEAIAIEIKDLIKVSANTPALGLFLVGLILIFIGVHYNDRAAKRKLIEVRNTLAETATKLERVTTNLERVTKKLTVSAKIAKSDNKSPKDVQVSLGWPPRAPDPSGKLPDFTVTRDSDGKFPTLTLLHPEYEADTVDLNSYVSNDGTRIVIPETETLLRRIPGSGGNL